MDQYIPPSERKSNNYFWLLPILLLVILLFGKKENRETLRGQIAYMMTDKAKDLKQVHKDLERTVVRHLFFSYGNHRFLQEYEEKVQTYPQYEKEITMLAAHVARVYGGEFVIWNNEQGKQSSIYGLGQNDIPNVDELPYFANCEEVSGIGKYICSESQLQHFIYQELKYPEGAKAGGVTIETTVRANGKLGDFEVIASSDTDEKLKEEAVRITQKMPDWIPAKRSGKAVDCKIYLAFVFEPTGMVDLYETVVNTDTWKEKESEKEQASIVPMFNLEWQRKRIQHKLNLYVTADTNKKRRFRAVQFSKLVRQLFLDYPDAYTEITDLVIQECKFSEVATDMVRNEEDKITDIVILVKETPEPNYVDEDELYQKMMEVIENYEESGSLAAEEAIEKQLGELFWDFINRFPDFSETAQSALQHACNFKKVPTHTVRIEKEKYQVIIDLIGERRQ
ncbi:MAG: energy transducer TonB [Bacteroidota bacterium]